MNNHTTRNSKARRQKNKASGAGQVRIIGGKWRGRKTSVFDLPGLRPTADRARETLFNWLMFDVAASNCLDLFAGSGVLGLECLSRNATSVTFVEQNPNAVQQIEASLSLLIGEGQTDSATVNCEDAIAFLSEEKKAFDIVFLDPPFDSDLLQEAVDLLAVSKSTCLADQAFIYLEYDREKSMPRLPQHWQLLKQKAIGQSTLLLVQAHDCSSDIG